MCETVETTAGCFSKDTHLIIKLYINKAVALHSLFVAGLPDTHEGETSGAVGPVDLG